MFLDLADHIESYYEGTEIGFQDRALPEFEGHYYVAGGEVTLDNSRYIPIKRFEVDEEEDFRPERNPDPHRGLTASVTGSQDEIVMFQVTFTPAAKNWTDGRVWIPSADKKAEYLRMGEPIRRDWLTVTMRDPTQEELDAADEVSRLAETNSAFDVNIRYFVFSPRLSDAERQADEIATTLYQTYSSEDYYQVQRVIEWFS